LWIVLFASRQLAADLVAPQAKFFEPILQLSRHTLRRFGSLDCLLRRGIQPVELVLQLGFAPGSVFGDGLGAAEFGVERAIGRIGLIEFSAFFLEQKGQFFAALIHLIEEFL
jgi:hypothetical protein